MAVVVVRAAGEGAEAEGEVEGSEGEGGEVVASKGLDWMGSLGARYPGKRVSDRHCGRTAKACVWSPRSQRMGILHVSRGPPVCRPGQYRE
jgi:hypothetical protein